MDGPALPIRRSRRQLVEAVRERPFLIVTGETGSGKSTQLPRYLYEAGKGTSPSAGCGGGAQEPINSLSLESPCPLAGDAASGWAVVRGVA